MESNITYTYSKLRKNFGRQPLFCEVESHIIDSISSDTAEAKLYCSRNPVHRYAQTLTSFKEHDINTKRITYCNNGVNHTEGGWSKDINIFDEESTSRYRRRIEKDDNYINFVRETYNKMEHLINQNNAIDMYTQYFRTMPPEAPVEKPTININKVYKDMDNRTIASIDWFNDNDNNLAVSYCDKTFSINKRENINIDGSIWDIEHGNILYTFTPPSACWQIVSTLMRSSTLIGGLEDGRVCIFDSRATEKPILLSPFHVAHRDPVSALLNIYSRHSTEFFSGSTDGKCMWWDLRNLRQPYDVLIMSVTIPPGEYISLANAEPISVLQYERSIPTRFLCGTDTGIVIHINRKGKTYKDKMSGVFKAHDGPVKAIHRSPFTSKIFLTCGDWRVHVWNEDIHISPVVAGTPHRYQISDVVWSPHRVSNYMSISVDGKLRCWDFLRKYNSPVSSLLISKQPLIKMKVHEDGRLIAIGDIKGSLSIVSLTDDLVTSGDRDKLLMLQTLERESRRERILENRIKEIRLKFKTTHEVIESTPIGDPNEDLLLTQAEEHFKKMIRMETRGSYKA